MPDAPSVTLTNDRLTMNVLLPDPKHGRYRGQRFDWGGMVQSLEVDGMTLIREWRLLGKPEAHDENALGTAEEFGLRKPAGYETAAVGEPFLKVGVGLLKRQQRFEYRFWEDHEVVATGQWRVEKGDAQITFTHVLDHDGWAYQYTKTIRLINNEQPGFIIERELKNTGQRLIDTDHYTHNFFAFGNNIVGPDYRVRLPFDPLPNDRLNRYFDRDGDWLVPKAVPETNSSFNADLLPQSGKRVPHDFTLLHQPSSARIDITGQPDLTHAAVFAMENVFCIEGFTPVQVKPGKTLRWHTAYRFTIPTDVKP